MHEKIHAFVPPSFFFLLFCKNGTEYVSPTIPGVCGARRTPTNNEKPICTNTRHDSLELERIHLNALSQNPPPHVPSTAMEQHTDPNGFPPLSSDDEQEFPPRASFMRENDESCVKEEEQQKDPFYEQMR